MSKGIINTIIGGALIAVGIVLEVVTLGASTPLSAFLITAGTGMLLSGIGTMLAGQPQQGIAVATRNPVAPWNVIYGLRRIGGTVVFIGEFGDSNKYLDMVIVLAAHACEAVDALLFDQQRVQIGANNTSFTPTQQDLTITAIVRAGNVVTVTVDGDIALLSDGDDVIIHEVPGDQTLNGRYPVTVLTHTPNLMFTYLSGGAPTSSAGGGAATTWPDYGAKVYMEAMLGAQVLGQTFVGMTAGTPDDGDPGNLITNPNNPWTSQCSLLGKTAVFLRLHYDDKVFSNGIPQISFLVRGKKDIYDPRTGLLAYTENAALCIADYLANKAWGFKGEYGTEIPTDALIAAANICDEPVPLARGGVEPRYTCNGTFQLSARRSEILQNMLTACAGRLVYLGGRFYIYPAAWAGVSVALDAAWIPRNSAGGFRWRPTVSISALYNGVKGTYVSPTNNWSASDFPRYAQDADHGYDGGAPEFNYDANLTEDGGDRRWLDIQLPFTKSSSMAQRIAKIELMRRRHQGTGTFALNMAGYRFAPLDVITADLPYFGWEDQYLEILAVRFKLDRQNVEGSEVVLLGTEIDVQETDPSIYAWDIGEELSPQGYQQAIVPDNRTPKPPTNFKATPDHGIILLTWDAPDDAYVLNGGHLDLRYQKVESPPGLWISLGRTDPSVTQMRVTGLEPLADYLFEIRSVNAAGVPSVWVQATAKAPEPSAEVWMPNLLAAPDGDPVYPPDDLTFAMQQLGSNLDPSVSVDGEQPVNAPTFVAGPQIGHVAANGSGGSLKAERTYYVTIAVSKAGSPSLPAKVETVLLPGGADTQQIVLGGLTWPPGTWDKWILYASIDREEMLCAQMDGDGGSLPTSITLNGPLKFATYSPANSNIQNVRLKIKQLFHIFAVGGFVTEVGAAVGTGSLAGGFIRCMHLAADRSQDTDPFEGGIDWVPGPPELHVPLLTSDDWTDRILSVLTQKTTGAAPILNFTVTGYDSSSGKFFLDPDPSSLGVGKGDVFAVRFKPQWNEDKTAFTDEGMLNGQYPLGTAFVDPPRAGRVIAGPGRGQLIAVTGHDNTSYTFASAFKDVDETSLIIIEFAPWLQQTNGNTLAIANYLTLGNLNVGIGGLLERGLLVQGVLVDVDGQESPDGLSPVREFFPFNDVSYGVGGKLQEIARFEFGRGSDGGPAAVAAGDISSIVEVDSDCSLQGWSEVNQGDPIGVSTADLLKYDADANDYLSILGASKITVAEHTHDKVIFSSAFKEGLDVKLVKGNLLKCVWLTVGATPPVSPVIRVFGGLPLPRTIDATQG